MKRLALAALFAASLTTPVFALDVASMSDADRAAFRAEIRAYLLDNPEVIMEAVAVLEQRDAAAQSNNDEALVIANAADLYEDKNSFVGGNPDGDIVMVEFLDYRCGYCKKAHSEVAKLLTTDGNVRLIVKEFPILGEQSVLASRFAISTLQNAGPDAYQAVHDSLMTLRGEVSNATLERLAVGLNLDSALIMEKMQGDDVTAVIAANHALGQRMNISGTPGFVVGNQMLRGYVPFDDMMQILDEIRG